ncbi:dienelactone hydrolase family protein [uncultured Flavobacterium sp.]|uniref:dienelactone hydrolase family protein n=1 Tax=uncultured Flavobacterium sp. TaxID=165435 RepID=UPI0030CA587A
MTLKNAFALFVLFSTTYTQAQLKTVSYSDENQKLEGFLATPKIANATKAGVIVLHAWMGISDHEKESAEKLAKLGYFAFVADVYGQGNKPTNTDEAGKLSGYFKNAFDVYQHRIQLAVDELVKAGANADEIAVIGYCFGGTGAIEAARGDLKVKGIVSFHGGLGKDLKRETKQINTKVLVLHGADDPYVVAKEVTAFEDEMRTAKADWQLNMYANAVHAFTHKNAGTDNSKGAAYNEKADKRSWEAMKIFFKELFEKI